VIFVATRKIPPIKLYFPRQDIEQIKSDVEKILSSGMLTMGEYTARFEREFAEVVGVKHSIAVNSGTSALEIALRSAGMASGDEVVVPTNTFTATAAAAIFAGGKPVLTDVSAETLCLDSENLVRVLTRRSRAVIVVHVGGLVCPDIDKIREICEKNHLLLIEDAAHAQGSTINGRYAGSLGDAGCFSFYPTKVMTTGEGGMITTDDDEIAQKALIMRDQGKENFHSGKIVRLGYNWRMPEISAAIGLVQLKRLPEMIEKRNKIARYFDQELDQLDGMTPLKRQRGIVNNYYKYTALLSKKVNRDEFKRKLADKGVICGGEVYWPPLHLQPVYEEMLDTGKGDYPVAEDVCARMVCLPMFSQMTRDEAEYVVERVTEVLSSFGVK